MFRILAFWTWTTGAAAVVAAIPKGMMMVHGSYLMRQRRYNQKEQHGI